MKRQPLLVEIVGTAGAGKTTLIHALHRHSAQIQPIFDFGSFRSLPYYIWACRSLLPLYIQDRREGGRYSWQEIKWMLRLRASHQIVRQPKADNTLVTIMDQGPVYTLARLLDGKCINTKGPDFTKWWTAMLATWAQTLDIVIWLDAPTEVLFQRVYSRNKWHSAKAARSEEEAMEMLAEMQRLHDETISALTSRNGPALYCWDTSLSSVEQIVENILPKFRLARN